jgi:hypothetical protein
MYCVRALLSPGPLGDSGPDEQELLSLWLPGSAASAIKCKFRQFLMQCDTCDECASINSSSMTRSNRTKKLRHKFENYQAKFRWHISNDVWSFVTSLTIIQHFAFFRRPPTSPPGLRLCPNRLSKERHKTFMFQWVGKFEIQIRLDVIANREQKSCNKAR